MKKYIWLIYCLTSISLLLAQLLPVRNYSTQDGLAQNQVTRIQQDYDAFIWLKTQGGVSQFDGYKFKNYNLNNGLPSNSIKSIINLKKEHIFIGFDFFSILEGQKFTTFDQKYFKKHLQGEALTLTYYEDNDDTYIFVCTNKKIFYYSVSQKKFKEFYSLEFIANETLNTNTLISIPDLEHFTLKTNNNYYFIDVTKKAYTHLNQEFSLVINSSTSCIALQFDEKESEYMIGIDNPINREYVFYHYSHKSKQLIPFLKSASIFYLISKTEEGSVLLEDKAGYNFFLTDSGKIYAYNYKLKKGYYTEHEIQSGSIDLKQMTDNYVLNQQLWISSNQGLIQYDMKTKQSHIYTTSNGLSNNNIQTMYIDRENNIWLGSNGTGVDMVVMGNITNYTSKNGLSHSGTTNAVEGSDGSIWVTTDNGVTRIMDKGVNIHYHSSSGLPHNDTWALARDKKNNIWVGTYNSGLVMYDGKRFINRRPKEVPFYTNYLSEIFVDKLGNIWVPIQSYLVKYDSNYNYTIFKLPEDIPIYQITEDESGYLWMAAAAKGIYVYDKQGNLKEHYLIDTKVFNSNIIGLEILNAEKVLCFTYGEGIVELNRQTKTYKKVYQKELKNFELCKAYVRDDQQNLWIGTINGIIKIDKQGKVQSYSKEDGLIGNDVRTTGAYKDHYGILWFSTSFGLVRINPNEQFLDKKAPSMIITEFQSNVLLDLSKEKHYLKYDNNTISFKYVGIDFRNPNRVVYQYYLENFDKNWSDYTLERAVRYTNLNPGKYIFKVRSIDHAGNSSEIAEIQIVITPPFWATWWFRTLLVIIIAGSVYLIILWRVSLLKKKNEELERIVALRTKQLREKNEQIISSIRYAERIQNALIPNIEFLKTKFKDIFVIFKPKDIISGDFYWFYESDNYIYLAVVDCTGHGVPGALLSIVGDMLLNETLSLSPDSHPSEILSHLHENVRSVLSQSNERNSSRDGMEISLCRFNKSFTELIYSGANRPLYLFVNDSDIPLEVIRPTRKCIGGKQKEEKRIFDDIHIDLTRINSLYMFSDGIVDQNNKENHKFGSKRIKKILSDNYLQTMEIQKKILLDRLSDYQESEPQRDDITMIGIKINGNKESL